MKPILTALIALNLLFSVTGCTQALVLGGVLGAEFAGNYYLTKQAQKDAIEESRINRNPPPVAEGFAIGPNLWGKDVKIEPSRSVDL